MAEQKIVETYLKEIPLICALVMLGVGALTAAGFKMGQIVGDKQGYERAKAETETDIDRRIGQIRKIEKFAEEKNYNKDK